MSLEPKKLQKIRTFSGDISAIKSAAAVPELKPEEPKVSVKPQMTFAPVLNEKKPIVIPPVIVKTSVAPPIPKTPAVPPSLQNDVAATLRDSKPSPAPLIKSVPKPSPSLADALGNTIPAPKERVEVMDRGAGDLSGTVITNQKKDRFKLLPSMWEAMKLWFQETENALAKRAEKKRQSIPTVRAVEDRKDIIKKAASVGALAPKDDYAKLTQKLPPRSKQPLPPTQSTVIIAEKAAVPAPSWGHYEGQEAPVVNKVKPVIPRVTQVPPMVVTPDPLPPPPPPEPQLPVVETPPPPKPIAVPEPVIVKEAEKTEPTPPPLPKPIPVPIPSPEIETPPPLPKPIAVPEPVIETPPPPKPVAVPEPVVVKETEPTPPVKVEPPRVKPVSTLPQPKPVTKKNFTWFFYVGVATTAIIAIVSGAGLVTWLLGESDSGVVSVTNGPANTIDPTPIREDSTAKAILARTRADWYANISASGRGGVITIIPIVNIGGAEKTASTPDVLATLNWGVESALTRSISDITFIMAEQKPVIILKVTSFDAAFGGLLLSERELSGELFPLFGPVVTSTYKVGVGTVAPEFVDELASNHDVRVLKDEMENERLVYGFVDQNTIVITPDKETFSLISERLR